MDPFQNALLFLKKIEPYFKNSKEYFERLKTPEKVIKGKIKVLMDDGSVKEFPAYRVQYNGALGPYKGGIRFHPNVCENEVMALAFWMAIKCSIAGLPYGGGKGGVAVDPKKLSEKELERLARAYARFIAPDIGPEIDVPAPDVNTNAKIMAWMLKEYIKLKVKSRKLKIDDKDLNYFKATFTGKPIEMGGSLGREEATGRGGVIILKALLPKLSSKLKIKNSKLTVAVQGFGNVGYHFARIASEEGFRIVAVSDSKGGIIIKRGLSSDSEDRPPLEGLDIPLVIAYKKKKGTVVGCCSASEVGDVDGEQTITNEQLLQLPVDVLVPAALEGVINEKNAEKIKAKIVLELANGGVTPKAEEILTKKGIIVVPDVLANCGGVTVSYFEWFQNMRNEKWTEEKVNKKLADFMKKAFEEVWEKYTKIRKTKTTQNQANLRLAAYILAIEKIIKKETHRNT